LDLAAEVIQSSEQTLDRLGTSETTFQEAATYGGLVDAIGGVATIVLAIVALSGVSQPMLVAVATIVFGATLLIQGGTMLTEYTKLVFPVGAVGSADEVGGGGGLSALFLVGAAGIVLGILALINISPQTLTSVAVIAFGGALILSSNSVWHLYRTKQAVQPSAPPGRIREARSSPVKWLRALRPCGAWRVLLQWSSAFSRLWELTRWCSRWWAYWCWASPCS